MNEDQDREQLGAPPASPWAEEAGRHEGEAGETSTGAPGLRGGPGPGAAAGLAGEATEGTLMPPEGEAAEMPGGEVRMTGAVAKPTRSEEDVKKAK